MPSRRAAQGQCILGGKIPAGRAGHRQGRGPAHSQGIVGPAVSPTFVHW